MGARGAQPNGYVTRYRGGPIPGHTGPRTTLAVTLRNQGHTVEGIAVRMRIAVRAVRYLLTCYDNGNEPGRRKGEVEMEATPGCARCGLRGVHECLQGWATKGLGGSQG